MSKLPELESLLLPISTEAPCGASLRYEPVYDEVREAHRADDPSLPVGIWQAPIKTVDWDSVERECLTMLTGRSKDLQLVGWLGEVWVVRYGSDGLAHALDLAAALCGRYWDGLHPLPVAGDPEYRSNVLSWLDKQWALRFRLAVPLVSGAEPDGETVTLADWQAALRLESQTQKASPSSGRDEKGKSAALRLRELITAVPVQELRRKLDDVRELKEHLAELVGVVGDAMAEDAPTFGGLHAVIAQAEHALRGFINFHPERDEPVLTPIESPALAATAAAAATPDALRPDVEPVAYPDSREEAYRQLAAIADYLARAEPHSPVPYLIRRAVAWGRMSLHQLIAELGRTDSDVLRLWSLIGSPEGE